MLRVGRNLRRAASFAAALVIVLVPLAGAGGRAARAAQRALLAAPVSPAKRPPAKTAAAKPGCRRTAFRVVVDVGHTLDVPGAISAHGIPEYAYNLALGGDIRKALLSAGFSKTVLLITAEAPPLGLLERAMRANHWPADLFISIHHDSVPDYLLETWDYAGQQYHYCDRFKGYAIFISNDNVARARSLVFARLLGEEMEARGLAYTPHYTLALMRHRRRQLVDATAGVYRYDQLIVLRDTRMPAVLLEAGSIINRAEELQMATPQRRARISAAVAAAVEDFCAGRADRDNAPPGSPPRAVALPTRGDADADAAP